MKCRLCPAEARLVHPFRPIPLASAYTEKPELGMERYPLDLYQCPQCGYCGLYDLIPPETVYPAHHETTGADSPGMGKHLEEYARWVMDRWAPPKDSLVLDIGSNDGTFLSTFHQSGYRVLGIEPSRIPARLARERDIHTYAGFWDNAAVEAVKNYPMPVGLVTANRVWANVDDLEGFTGRVLEVLEPDGLFILETGYLKDILENCLVETIYHEHISYDLLSPLVSFLFKRKGFRLVDIDHIPIKGGSVRLVFRKGLTELKSNKSYLGFRTDTEDAWMATNPWQKFKEMLEQAANHVHDEISFHKFAFPKEPLVCGYGAGTPGAALIYQLHLEQSLDFVVDDNPIYWGKYVPGTDIQVRPPEELNKAGACVILAHRYAQRIMEKNPEFTNWVQPFESTATKSSVPATQPLS